MTWKDIVLTAIASAGGIGGIIVLVVKFSANIIADRLEKKYTLKIDKELEKYKSSLESKIYISKTKFDTEFGIYRELSKAFFDMVKNITTMIPDGFATYPADKEQRKEYEHNLYVEAQKSTVLAQDALNANAPFIPESFFKQYDEILGLCKRQITAFQRRWNVLYFASQDEKESFSMEDYKCSKLIREQFEKLNSAIREYISKLDVTE